MKKIFLKMLKKSVKKQDCMEKEGKKLIYLTGVTKSEVLSLIREVERLQVKNKLFEDLLCTYVELQKETRQKLSIDLSMRKFKFESDVKDALRKDELDD